MPSVYQPEPTSVYRSWFAAAIAAARKESIQEGITHLQKAISIYPKYLQAQLMLGDHEVRDDERGEQAAGDREDAKPLRYDDCEMTAPVR